MYYSCTFMVSNREAYLVNISEDGVKLVHTI
jgi:hypothetical protein